MNYDSFCMAACVDELRAGCAGAFVDQVYQPEPLLVTLAFTGRGPRRFWLLSSDARWPRAHATTVRRPNPDTAPAFAMLLRKHLNGARLAEAEQVRFDRILRLTFRRGDETRVLVHEVMGRHSNLMLLGEDGIVLGAVKPVPHSQTRVRPVLPGLPYAEPPGERPDPRALSREEIEARLGPAPAADEITRALSGWGTFAAREAVARAAAEGASTGEVVFRFMERVRQSRYEPTVFEEQGRPRGVWAFPSIQEGWRPRHPARTVSAACDEFYTFQEAHAGTEALRKTVEGALERALRTARQQLAEAEGSLEGIAETEQLKIQGELLSANAATLERGAEFVELPNWYDPEGGTLRIALDPQLDGRENAERFFRRYRRGMAAAEAALERIPLLRGQEAELSGLLARAEAAEEEELRSLRETARARGWLREASARAAEDRPPTEFPTGVRVRRVPVGQWEVYYGENATSNDYLTTRWAKPGDLWLHARAITGTHVVIRGVNSLDRLPPDVLREAARLAAAHSEAKHSSVVAVDYTFRRYVRKPRGSGPGFVIYSGEKTIHVDPQV